MRNDGYPIARYIGFACWILVFGIPGVGFLVLITWGAILMPATAMVMLLPFVAINFLLWR